MADLHEKLRGTVEQNGASGTFSTFGERMQGHVVTAKYIAGVWADRSGSDRIIRAVFYRITNGKVVVEEFNVDWSYWDLVEKERHWMG
jgi:hypothetical protein